MTPTDSIALRENNPYSTGYLFEYPDGSVLLHREDLVFDKSKNDRYYTLEEGVSIRDVAFAAYGDSKLYWVIKDANNIEFDFDLAPGTTLRIPDYEKAKATVL